MFAHTLALALGEVDVDGMLAKITPLQFAKWKLYHRRHPFGGYWEWHKAALAAWATVNFNPLRGKDAKMLPIHLFIPDLEKGGKAGHRKQHLKLGKKYKKTIRAGPLGLMAAQSAARVIDVAAIGAMAAKE